MKKTYLVTERAGEWIAGQRKPESGRMVLSDKQAAYELALGSIEPIIADKPQEPEPEPDQKPQRRKSGR